MIIIQVKGFYNCIYLIIFFFFFPQKNNSLHNYCTNCGLLTIYRDQRLFERCFKTIKRGIVN